MSLIIPANTLASGGYEVANSLRFNDGSSDYLNRTLGSDGNRQKWTWSGWVKRGTFVASQMIFGCKSGDISASLNFRDDQLRFFDYDDGAFGSQLKTNRLFRDVSAWYHIVVAYDTTQGTAANRIKFYVNGVQETSFATSTYPSEDFNGYINESDYTHYVGSEDGSENFFDGYIAEVCFINDQQLAPTSFGEFDEDSGIWKPIDVSGLTFGNNGYYLDFEASGNLGNDANGGTDFTEANLAAVNQSTDTCTNNFATMNPLDNFYYNGTFSEGNLKGINGSSREASATATIAISNGKWFWEVQPKTNVAPFIGIQQSPSAANTSSGASMSTNGYGYLKTGKVETSNGSGGSTVLAEYATYAADDIIGVAVDLDGNKIYFYKNGALQGSGVTITAVGSTTNGHYLIAFGALGGQDTFEINFGSPPYSESGGETDGDGFGNFAHAVPSGYFALCTKNLAEYG